jgi:outer membrane protein
MPLIHKMLVTGFMLTAAVTASSQASANDQGDLLVRGRIINVNPNDSSGTVSTIPGSGVKVDSATTLELDFTYMIRPNIGLELILATTKHDIKGDGTIGALDKVGETGVLPPTLTAQYHFAPKATIRPYAGIGVNYTLFYSEKASSSLEGALGSTSVSLDNSFGLAAQAGVDVDINKDWFLNLDLKYINISTTAELNSGGTTRSVDVDINPWVIGIGVGKTF